MTQARKKIIKKKKLTERPFSYFHTHVHQILSKVMTLFVFRTTAGC